MEYVIVDLYLPACGETFDLRLPCAMNSHLAAHLASRAIAQLTENRYLPSHSSFFAWRDDGSMLNMDKTLEQCGVKNGSRLLLI